jgi:hypothetical protein
MEFFIQFFELVGKDFLDAMEEKRLGGEVIKSINLNFIALIPKVNCPSSFGDFRPLALCNLCYKIIAKIIARRIRPILSHSFSEEQHGFLKGRHILDAIDTTQECLHSIKVKKLQAIILKLDLKKAYDCINWDFLRLTLLQCGFGLPTTNWIMGCASSAAYAILINRESTKFFQSGRGLKQGCPLSSLLFILVMEGLSLSLKKGQADGKLSGIKVSILIKILHLLFVDDVLIMTKGLIKEWQEINRIIDFFCGASGLMINVQKSKFLHFRVQQGTLEYLKELFHYNFNDLLNGFIYLGYFLKLDSYKVEDWHRFISKFEKRINQWCNRWLSLPQRSLCAYKSSSRELASLLDGFGSYFVVIS